jgi:hypothetical protein
VNDENVENENDDERDQGVNEKVYPWPHLMKKTQQKTNTKIF